MAKMWSGRTLGEVDKLADSFNSSISFDKRMFSEDITGSIAHARMLAKCGIISGKESDLLTENLEKIREEISSGQLMIDCTAEDIHMFVEEELTKRIGDAGKKLHTARSRNDQVALDFRMYVKKEIDSISKKLTDLIDVICSKAEEYKSAIMPGYTHLQRAQPITFGHELMAYAYMFLRDKDRLCDCKKRMNSSPIGSCALAGTTYETDRFFEAEKLGFDSVIENSVDGVSDRDYAVEFLSALSLIMMHISRFSEEIILWSSWEFRFVTLSDSFTTGSSIMPQKKNPDMAELARGKTGRVYGDLMSLLTVLKGIPLAYNKDMQEDKESVFDAADTANLCLEVFCGMIKTMKAETENMKNAAKEGFINATDFADYLVTKGLPFRSAYKVSGETVSYCIKKKKVLEELTLEEFGKFSELVKEDVYEFISLETCVNKRQSFGGTSVGNVEMQIASVREKNK